MATALLITTNDRFKVIDYEPGLDFLYKHIETDIVQVVIPYGLQLASLDEKYIMIADEEALLKDNPKFNIYASTFHGSPVFGNVMILKTNDEDFEGLEKEDHNEIAAAIQKLLNELEQQYHGN